MSQCGVVFQTNMTYCVKRGSETREVLLSLYWNGNLSSVKENKRGLLFSEIETLINCGYKPYKAFLNAFFKDCPSVEIPVDFCCMETAAWSMAEIVFKYELWKRGETLSESTRRYFDEESKFYDYSVKHLKPLWGIHEDHWKEIVLSLFCVQY